MSAICPAGKNVIAGGYSFLGAPEVVKLLVVRTNFASALDTWRVHVVEGTETPGAWAVTVRAVCAAS